MMTLKVSVNTITYVLFEILLMMMWKKVNSN